jgi:hypothetical protein
MMTQLMQPRHHTCHANMAVRLMAQQGPWASASAPETWLVDVEQGLSEMDRDPQSGGLPAGPNPVAG